MQSRAARTARGWMTGAFATGVAASSHGIVDGAAPSLLALTAALVFAGLLGTFLAGRRASLPRLVVIVAGSQLAFHVVFSWLTPGTATVAGHHEAAVLLQPAIAHHGGEPAMWAAHLAAMLFTIAFLRHAELALWNLVRDAVAATGIARAFLAVAERPPVARVAVATAPWHPASAVVVSSLGDRGPPVVAGV